MNLSKYRRWAILPVLALVFGLLSAAPAGAHAGSEHLVKVGEFEVPFEGLTSDVWALGNYAYLGSFSSPGCSFDITGTRIIDISDPEHPELASFIRDAQGTRTNDVKAFSLNTKKWSGDILITTNEGCGLSLPRLNSNVNAARPRPGQGGINIYDVSDPTKPRSLKKNFLRNGIHNTYVWEDGDNAYLMAVDDVAARDVIIVDITNPSSPKVVTVTGAPDWPGLDFSEIEGAAVFLHDVWVQDGIAYLSYWDAGLVLLDVSNPADPTFLGDSTYPTPDASGLPPEGNGHVAVPAVGNLVIFGDEDTAKFSGFLKSTIGAGPQGTNKVGFALFGPNSIDDVPTFGLPGEFPQGGGAEVVAVADNVGCNPGDFVDASPTGDGDVVLIERGACFFSTKASNAEAAGYDAYIVFNSVAGGDGLINMSAGTAGPFNIPGIFITRTLGSAMKAELVPGPGTVAVDALAAIADGEGFMRVFDVTDPTNMVQIGQYSTERNLPPANALAAGGTRDAHNVVVDGDYAYWAWYHEGIRVVEFSDCGAGDGFNGCTPTEVAHFGGGAVPVYDFWGVYLHTIPADGGTYILGSDRGEEGTGGGGLAILAFPPAP